MGPPFWAYLRGVYSFKSIKRDSHLPFRHNSHQLLRFLTHCRMNGLGNRAALRVPGAFSWTINAQDGQVKCRFKCPLPAQKQIDKSLRPSRQHANGWRCGRSATSLLSRKTRCRAKTPPRQRAKRTREDATGRGAGQATGRLMAEASRSATERRAHRPPAA